MATEGEAMKTDLNVPNVGIVSADMGELNIIHSDQIRDIIEKYARIKIQMLQDVQPGDEPKVKIIGDFVYDLTVLLNE